MRCVFVCVALAVIGVTNAFAGNVYGTIRENNQPLKNLAVILICGTEEKKSGTTDKDGVYRFFTASSGSCTLEITVDGRQVRGTVSSYDEPTQYDFDLVREKIQEETGITVRILRLISEWSYKKGTELTVVGITYQCEYLGGNVELSSEHTEYRWMTPVELEKLGFNGNNFRRGRG